VWTDPAEIDQFLTMLRRHGVTSWTDGGLTIVLGPAPIVRERERVEQRGLSRALGDRILDEVGAT
jgi:hypothetical protein